MNRVAHLHDNPSNAIVKATGRRRLVRLAGSRQQGSPKIQFDDERKSDVTPIRFVCAYDKGHLQDIDWRVSGLSLNS